MLFTNTPVALNNIIVYPEFTYLITEQYSASCSRVHPTIQHSSAMPSDCLFRRSTDAGCSTTET